jgi:hypothetical protein
MKIALVAASLVALLSIPAHGREIQVGSELVCNTAKQVEKFVAFSEADPRTAISATNDEENDPKACAVVNIAFVRGHNTVTVRTRNATYQIADILVVGVITDNGVQYVTPAIQFSLFQVDERKA